MLAESPSAISITNEIYSIIKVCMSFSSVGTINAYN